MVTRKDVVTRAVQVMDILPGPSPQILTVQQLGRLGRPGRLFQQLVPVSDPSLFTRFLDEVSKGDTVTITVTTDWFEGGGYRTYLSDFASSPSGGSAELEESEEWIEEATIAT